MYDITRIFYFCKQKPIGPTSKYTNNLDLHQHKGSIWGHLHYLSLRVLNANSPLLDIKLYTASSHENPNLKKIMSHPECFPIFRTVDCSPTTLGITMTLQKNKK